MQTIDDILQQAAKLSADERRKLIDSLEEGLSDEQQASDREAARLVGLDRWLSRAGTGHSDFTDVARDKYKHLAEAYSDGK